MWLESCGQESKFENRVESGRQRFAAPPGRLPAAVLTEDCCTQSMKSVDSTDQGLVGFAVPGRLRQKGTAQSARQGEVSDEKIILPPTTAGPHAASNHLWAVTEPDWAERIWVGNFKTCSYFCSRERICITHSDLMDFPMFTLDSPFLLTCSNNESLMCTVPFFPSVPEFCFQSSGRDAVWTIPSSVPSLWRTADLLAFRTRVSVSACCRAIVWLLTSRSRS